MLSCLEPRYSGEFTEENVSMGVVFSTRDCIIDEGSSQYVMNYVNNYGEKISELDMK